MSLNIIIKRDGTEEIFDPNKIVNAIKKAFIGTGCTENPRKIAEEVCTQIIKSQKTPSVECVQDLVEKSLIEHNLYKEAKAYILYRNHRTEIRESKSELYDVVGSVLDNCNKDNANISNSPSAKMLQIGEAASERYYSNKVVSKKFVELHKAKRIHIHDFTFYGKTVNCLNIPLGKLLDEGFDNGHGTIRSPQKISSAAALAAIILQSNQNSMFGGQAFSKFDEDMAKYVQREYNRQYKQLLDEYCDINDTTVDEVGKNAYLISKLEKRAMENTEKETFQAMEALVYNLNSMHSRAGSQVPFSSISLGLDTTKWGRMITRNLLKAYRRGLGKGEQPIFPNIIFQVKKGVNRSEGDPNYDLFKESIKTTSSRLFPSYCNEDASFNLPYYNKGVKVAYMGCRTRVVTDVNGEDMCDSRGNLFFTTINLPALALEVLNEVTEENKTLRVSKFYEKLHDMIETVKDHLLKRYHHVCKLKVKDLPFLMDQNLYIGSEGLDYNDTVENAFKHGSLTFGFIGLAETLKALIGKHHGESEKALEIGEEIVKYIREKADEYSDEYHLNFTVIASPAESTCMKMVNHDKKEFGLIEGVTDKEWYTNSFHVPVEYNTDFIHKIQVEGRFHKYCNGGHISYIELDACPAQNPNALEDMLNIMFDNDMGYMSINFPTDFCEDCGLHGVVISENTCPRCGGSHISRVRRVTGYLSKITNFNKGKLAELKHRVAHGSFN